MKPLRLTTPEEWRAFLQRWSDEWLSTDEKFPAAIRRSNWLGYKPATEAQIARVEKRLGYRLPPSYRAFLLATNGWRRTSPFVERVRPIARVQWLEMDDPELLEPWSDDEALEPLDGCSHQEYFAYDGRPLFDVGHFRQSLKIADPVQGDSALYVLNPLAVAEDGEWEAWLHAHWIPGAERFPSFALLMQAEYRSFCNTQLGRGGDNIIGPFTGTYAPDRPRGKAISLGAGKPRPRRLTVAELVARLEDPSPKVRKDAAKQLFREYKPHDPNDERPEMVAPLARVLQSTLETDVRCAAACMLGTYGDEMAIAPLVKAMEDDATAVTALSALHYLSLYRKDARIADALCRYIAQIGARDFISASTALHILEDFKDPRLAEIALRILDEDGEAQLRIEAAFAVATASDRASDPLIARLTHSDTTVRTAAAAALRQTGDRRAIGPLRVAMNDPDPSVRMQAAVSLRFLGEDA